ncbi:MAG: 4-hydroxy-tetrahydrodipicolinate synthase [Rikenellaceae bacterium]|nr:4-hydroxy-tetrahydrodipicolinate synthase [Rikenellaceae bacterium]
MKNNIQGTGVALVTPFKENTEIDYNALNVLIENVITGGADYIVALGTTAETPTLTKEEKKELVKFIMEKNGDRVPVVLGVGGNNTAETVKCFGDYDMDKIAAVLSVTPYYNRPSQRGLYEHYKSVAQASPKPVMLYNVPGRTGVNMSAETTLKLALEVENIFAVKEASGSLSQISYILRDRPENFMVISGDDNMALPLIALGGDGVISVAANAFPEKFCRMVKLCLTGDFTNAAILQMSLLGCIDSLFLEGNPVGIKTALAVKGVMSNTVRLPLVSGSDELRRLFEDAINKYELC